jgi:hypothetical protein
MKKRSRPGYRKRANEYATSVAEMTAPSVPTRVRIGELSS